MGTDTARIELREVTKRYAGNVAVEGVSLSLAAGTVHALVGANGAGKSTIGKMIAGAVRADSGEILVNGETLNARSPREALSHGVTLISQELALVPELSVVDNVYLGAEFRRGYVLSTRRARRAFQELVVQSGFDLDPDTKVKDLGIADQQKVEILRAISRRASVIVMDEPTSSLTADESERLHDVIRQLAANGATIVLVSHFLNEVLMLADTVTVVRNGELVSTGPASAETENTLITAMLGHAASADYAERHPVAAGAPTVLEVKNLRRNEALRDISLHIRAGEILGVAGLVGSGRTELARAIFGVDEVDGGTVTIDGVRLAKKPGPRTAIERGVVMLPENRKLEGLVMGESAAANVTLPYLRGRRGPIASMGWMRTRREQRQVAELLGELSIKPADPSAVVATMSGGNQQKVLFAKCLFRPPRVLLLDEPSRGVDVGARKSIHELINRIARQGTAVLLISSDLEEVLALSHRVLVLHRGSVAGEAPSSASMDEVMELAFGLPNGNRGISLGHTRSRA